ncbi:MAG: hypothetical protein U5N58_05990 [Actinomycetota bacterium]|nr:hypothetical protein [Actinomycetota bacterium]
MKAEKKKSYGPQTAAAARVSRYKAPNEKQEVSYILSRINQYIKDEGKSYRDFAIFYRTNAQSRAVEEQFVR